MPRIHSYIVYLIVLQQLASRVGHPVLEGRKKRFSIVPPPHKKSTPKYYDPFELQKQSEAAVNSFIVLSDDPGTSQKAQCQLDQSQAQKWATTDPPVVLWNNSTVLAAIEGGGTVWGEAYLETIKKNDLMKNAWLVWYTQYDLELADLDTQYTSNFQSNATQSDVITTFASCPEREMTNIVMVGPPGSGKGTHGPFIRDALCICHLATGDMLREAIAAGTQLGQTADALMKRGELVPDELVIGLIKENIGSDACSHGILFDGFPRTLQQAQMLDTLMAEKDLNIDRVIEFQVDEEVLLERIEGRRIHQPSGRSYHLKFNPPKLDGLDDLTGEPLIHRKDDTKEALDKRMTAYHENTEPILGYYGQRGVLWSLDATAPISEVSYSVEQSIQFDN